MWRIPGSPKLLARIEVPQGWHSHKVRVSNGIMIVNHERNGPEGDTAFGGGLGIYDVSKPSEPRQIGKWRTHGKGVHRYDFDGRYAYISPTAEGYVGNIAMILDLKNPEKPEEVGPLVDSRPMEGRRRTLSLGRLDAAALPPSHAHGRPALCQLLASRLLHPRHLRYVEAAGDRRRQYLAGLSPSHPYLPADSATAEGPQCHGGGG